jgi:hypothetical protein
MAATHTHHEALHTRGAQVLARFLPLHEEHAPLGFGADPHDAVLRVGAHVGDAARLAPDGSPVLIAVPLSWAAATALAVIPRLDPEGQIAAAAAKDELLARIDRLVPGRLEATKGSSPAELVAVVAAGLGSALDALADAELDAVGDALFELAVAAVVAVELLERAA